VLLRLTDRGGVLQNAGINRVVGGVVNAVRSTPFIILLVAIIPFTRLVAGSSIGTAAAVVAADAGRRALHRAAGGDLAARSGPRPGRGGAGDGREHLQIVFKVLLPEALPGIVAGFTITLVSLTGYSAMAAPSAAAAWATWASATATSASCRK
jgi:D-methionine transport system permease protein